jgi:gamma-glutamylcyclotransferase (GGCT)/AIG2-like uncharacterized protein YtfP
MADEPVVEQPTAKITFERVTGVRGTLEVTGRSVFELDKNIIEAIDELRVRDCKMVKTEMDIHGVEWVYEYDSTGHIERTFRMGEVVP